MCTIAKLLVAAALIVAGVLTAQPVAAAAAGAAQSQARAEPELIPGAHLMSAAEREQYRQRMKAAATAEEKARIRAEHTDAMELRARNVGLSLSREPVGKRSAGDPVKGSALHNVCFSCHGPERYTMAKEKASSFLAASLATAGGIEEAAPVQMSDRAPSALPPGAPRMGRSQVKNLAGLKQAIVRWNDYFNPKLTEAEVNDLVAYLNAAYYKF